MIACSRQLICILPQTPFQCFFFFFNDTATTEIYTLSLHDALPICRAAWHTAGPSNPPTECARIVFAGHQRSEEHTSELQSRLHLVCRLLLEKKKKRYTPISPSYAIGSKLYTHPRNRRMQESAPSHV